MTHVKKMNEEITRRPDGAYLIESAPKYRKYQAAKNRAAFIARLTAPMGAFMDGYQSELDRMLDASAVYLGPGK